MINHVGDVIASLRRERGLTQAQLADRTGVGAPHISKVERGLEHASEQLLGRIAEQLGVEGDWLVLTTGRIPERFRHVAAHRACDVIEALEELHKQETALVGSDTADMILAAIRAEADGIGHVELCARVGLHPLSVALYVLQLEAEGLIRDTDEKVYPC